MLVHFLTDAPARIPTVRAMLAPRYRMVPHLLGADDADLDPNGVIIVDADLRQADRVEQIRQALRQPGCGCDRLFVVHHHLHRLVVQAYALGATAVASGPGEILSSLAQIQFAKEAPRSGVLLASTQTMESVTAFASIFSAAMGGTPVDLSDAERATSHIISSVEQNGLAAWLDDVRRHHEGTFQHCLLATGVAIGFALDLGFASRDVKQLGMAATLHDIGKARIPLSILDKPGRLDRDEIAIMKRHSTIGFEVLKDIPGISPESLAGVRHHHEYMDGSGYPDGLTAGDLSDLVRMLTISDIFAALIESRAYKPVMPRQVAYDILSGMEGKLERPLVDAFRFTATKA
ncbi:MAG: HD domain-containing protein [Xanthobacteraceae bacterium]|nr:HD domain-containing protein [Xanthobacteraceae bacterium]